MATSNPVELAAEIVAAFVSYVILFRLRSCPA